MTKLTRHVQVATAIGISSLMATQSVMALGFKNPDQDASATAQGEAFVAQADDASAVYYNPAGLTQVPGTQFTSGGYFVFRDITFKGTSGNTEEMNDPAYTLNAYVATDLKLEKWRFGFGYNVPYGNMTDWGKNSSFRYQVTQSELIVGNFAFATAYQITDTLSLGAELNYYNGQTELNRLVPFSILFPGLPDGKFQFEGDGGAIGATAGLLWKINKHWSFGAVYRSPFAIDFHGQAVVKNDPTGLFGRSAATAEITFPQSVTGGLAWRPTDKLKLEVDVEWTDWDTLNSVRLHSPNPAFANDPGSTIPFNWMSSFFYEFGAQYQLKKDLVLRAGYIYSENTVPNSTFSPTLPDGNRNVVSCGVGYTWKRFTVDLTYQWSRTNTRTVKNSADTNFDGVGDLDGTWNSHGNAVMVSSTTRF